MGAASALTVVITKADAVARIDRHFASWLVRAVSGTRGTLTSIELVHLPFWTYHYRARRKGAPHAWTGRLAIESRKRTVAVLPDTTHAVTPPTEATLLPAASPPPEDEVRRVLFWEALAHRRRDRPDTVELEPPSLLYVPFWLGYLRGEVWDICPVDATSGKIDLAMKEALLEALSAQETERSS